MIYLITNNKEYFNLSDDICFCEVKDALEYCENLDWIEVDTETRGFDPYTCKILSLQLGNYEKQFVIDTLSVDILVFKDLLEKKALILQNAKFDLRFLYHAGIEPNTVYDTLLMECLLTAGQDRKGNESKLSLDALAFKYAEAILDKSIRGQIHIEGLSNRVIKYAADDVKYLTIIKEAQEKLIRELELEKVALLENEVVKVFARMEYDGVKIDATKWKEVSKGIESDLTEILGELDSIVLEEPKLRKFVPSGIQSNLFGYVERVLKINWSSNSQKLDVVRELGINTDSVGDAILQRNKKKHKLIPSLIKYNKGSKLSSSFGMGFLKFINKVTGRVHPNYWQILSTGRISVKDPNVNQIPSKGESGKLIRSGFIAPKGFKIVGGDFSGMELRIIAEFSNDPLWVNAFKNGEDLHSVLCAKTFDIPIENVKNPFPEKPEMTYRDVQKTINFGLAYGMSEHKLADTMQIEVDKAAKIIKKFFSVVPDVEKFLTVLGNSGKRYGRIRTAPPFRRIRFFPQWKDSLSNSYEAPRLRGEIERKSKNHPIQGTNADIIKLALVSVYNEIKKDDLPVKILLSVYDEIQTECKEDFAEEWKTRLENIMIASAKEVIKNVPIVVDCKISDYWTK